MSDTNPIAPDEQRPAARWRVLFLLYGVVIGILGALAMTKVLASAPWLAGFLSALLIGLYAFYGWTMSDNQELTVRQRLVILPVWPLAMLAGLFGIAVFGLILACCWPFHAAQRLQREARFRQLLQRQGRLLQLTSIE